MHPQSEALGVGYFLILLSEQTYPAHPAILHFLPFSIVLAGKRRRTQFKQVVAVVPVQAAERRHRDHTMRRASSWLKVILKRICPNADGHTVSNAPDLF